MIEEESAAAESLSSQTAPSAADLKALMGEVGKALKAFSPSNMKTLIIEEGGEEKAPKWDCSLANIEHLPQTAHRKMAHEEADNTPVEGDTGLVDSGATHALRSGTEAEMQKAINVSVTLAGDEKATLQQSQLGTILVPSPSQPIVPMGALVEVLGCTIKWTKTALKIWHPKHGHLKVGLRNRCPEIAALDALQLIKELEEKQVEEFNSQLHEMELRLEALQCDESKSWTEHLLTFRKDGSPASMWKALRTCPFTKELPVDVLEMMVEGFDPSKGWEYLKGLPLSRKQRKRFMSSNAWVVHLYSVRWITHPTLRSPSKEIGCSWRLISPSQRRGTLIKRLLSIRRCSGQRAKARTWSILRSRPAEGFSLPEGQRITSMASQTWTPRKG